MYYSKYIIFTLLLLLVTLTRPTNSYGVNYDNLPDSYHYKNNVRFLIPSNETIIIHFEAGLSQTQQQAILDQELANHSNVTQANLEFGEDYVLIHLQSPTDVLTLTNNLYNNADINFSYPVFKDDSTQLVIPTDEVIVKLTSGYTITDLQNVIANYNGVTIDNSKPQRNPQEFVLKVTDFASTNCMDLANSLSIHHTMNYACPNFMVQLLPQSVDADTDCETEEGYSISNKQWALNSDGSYGGIARIVEGAGVNAPKAWDYLDNVLQISPANKPKIAILDDGIYSGHNALTVSSVLDLWEEPNNTTSGGIPAIPFNPPTAVFGGIKSVTSAQVPFTDVAELAPDNFVVTDQEFFTAAGGGGFIPVNPNPPTLAPTNPFPLKHGTRCAGIIAANPNAPGNANCVSGVAYNRCNLIDVRFTKRETAWYKTQMSSCLTIADAITKAAYDEQADIILLPYAFAHCENVQDAIEDVSQNGRGGKGTLVVISAGNYGYNHDSCFPANVDDVLAVGWSTQHNERKHPEEGCDLNDNIGLKITCKGSNRNWKVDVVAPGSDIITTGHRNPDSYPHFFQGTSASASLAAGVLALILNAHPNATNQEAQDILKSTCDKIHKYDYYHAENGAQYPSDPHLDMYKSDDVGYGKINAYNAVVKAAQMAGLDNQTTIEQNIWTRIHNQGDGVIERSNGTLDSHNPSFPIAHNTSNEVAVGLRFDCIALPAGAIITNTFIRFTAFGDIDASARDLTIQIEEGDASYYDDIPGQPNELTNRTYAAQLTNWPNIPRWLSEKEYDTPNLSSLVQAAVDHPSWRYSGALSFLFTNVSTNTSAAGREVYAYEMAACKSPQLFIEYIHPSQMGKTDLKTPFIGNSTLDNPTLKASFYPIPFDHLLQGTITFKQASKAKQLHIEVYNVYGQLIDHYTQNDPQHRQEITLNTQEWSKGVYFIQVKAGDATYNTKVIK